jgi:hypothetical protein
VRHIIDILRYPCVANQLKPFIFKYVDVCVIVLDNFLCCKLLFDQHSCGDQAHNPKGAYDFDSWKHYLTSQIRSRYETLHKDLLYTDEQQNFEDALLVFEKVNKIFMEIDE